MVQEGFNEFARGVLHCLLMTLPLETVRYLDPEELGRVSDQIVFRALMEHAPNIHRVRRVARVPLATRDRIRRQIADQMVRAMTQLAHGQQVQA